MDSIIVCRNSQGTEVRATALRVTRHTTVFEVYNPYSIVQLSEVLSDFRIVINERTVYSGRAVVTNIVNTGTMLICEATLVESWLDVDLLALVREPGKLQSDFAEFLGEWSKIHQVTPDFKVIIADIQTLLMDLRGWFEQVEFGIRSQASVDQLQLEREVIEHLRTKMLPAVDDLFERFENIANQIDQDFQPAHRAYVRRQIHPLVLCSPFAYRTYHKPLGYAGDYEMVNMILRDPLEGSSLFAKAVNAWFLSQAPAEAHRNRIDYLTYSLTSEIRRVAALGRPAKILNLGCGPAKEIQILLSQSEVSNQAKFTLLDFNDETFTYTTKLLNDLTKQYRRDTELNFVKKSVHQLLKEGASQAGDLPSDYDVVYCAGLFDYLSDRICKRLMEIFYEMLAPGGLLIVTNVDPSNPIRGMMEYVLEWHLIYRDSNQLQALSPSQANDSMKRTQTDSTGVNAFLQMRKTP